VYYSLTFFEIDGLTYLFAKLSFFSLALFLNCKIQVPKDCASSLFAILLKMRQTVILLQYLSLYIRVQHPKIRHTHENGKFKVLYSLGSPTTVMND